jgi:ribosomal protein S18 acetylase RimI-like enzyme
VPLATATLDQEDQVSAEDDVPASLLELASRIQDSIRANACRWRDCERIGPFIATFNREDANPYLNYAIPDDAAMPLAADVDALVDAYRKRDRQPRLEYIPALAPAVEPVLLAEGFDIERRTPLMTCTAAPDVREVAAEGVELIAPSSEEEYLAAVSVQWEAYEEQGSVPRHAVEALRRTVDAGGVVVLARDIETREPAGAGACTAPHDGLTELTSVGVPMPFRRRGIAAAMASWLAEQAFAKGMTGVFLMAHGEAEARIYARAGFVSQSEVLHISRP